MPYIKLPDAIWRYSLSSTELMVYVALRRHVNPFGRCIVKHRTLAQLIGCSPDTISRATRRLEDKGLLTIHNCRDKATGDQIANGYTLELLGGGYTKIPASIFACKLSKSDFRVYLYLLKCRSKIGLQAVPSLSQMVSVLHMSKRTVVDAIRRLDSALFICKAAYHRKQDRRLGHNQHTVLSPSLRRLVLHLAAIRKKRCRQPVRKAARKALGRKKQCIRIIHNLKPYFKGLEQKNRRSFYFLI